MADLFGMLQAAAGNAGEDVDPNFNQTVLLLHGDGTNGAQNNTFLDSSTNNFTITRNGNTTQGTFSPFSAPDGRWSVAFDGSNDGIMYNDGANSYFDLSNNDWTFECWVYRNVTGVDHGISQIADGSGSTIGSNAAFGFYIESDVLLFFTPTLSGLGSNTVTGSTTVTAGVWHHVAVTRNGNTFTIYLDGTSEGSFTASGTFTNRSFMHLGYYYGNDAGGGIERFLNGYLSNVRFVNGTAITPPSGGPTSPLADVANTDLLTFQSNRFVDNSANNLAVDTFRSTPTVTPFSPFAPTAAYDASVNGGSGYFDGTGDYLSVGAAGDWTFMSNASALFSVEWWIYFVATGSDQSICGTNNGLSANVGFIIQIAATTNVVQFEITRGVSGSRVLSGATTGSLVPNAWNHILFTYDQSLASNNCNVYLNGASAETFSKTANAPSASNPSNPLYIGSNNGSASLVLGYIGSMRVSNVVRSSGIPTAPLTSDANTKLLANFTNAGIFDQTGKNNLETVADAQIDTTTKKFGTGSMEFDGTGDYLVTPSSPNIQFGTGDYTVEMWIYKDSSGSGERGILATQDSGIEGVSIWADSTTIYFEERPTAFSGVNRITGTISENAFVHIAAVRYNGTFYGYVNGVSAGDTASSKNLTGSRVLVGSNPSATNPMKGFIDDLRITKGVARYTSAFTPPTKAFPDL